MEGRELGKAHPGRKRLLEASSELYGASANDTLKAEWAFLRKACKGYGFGRHELLPVRNELAIGKYVGKYISKHINCRLQEDKGARLVGYWGGADRWNCKFSWTSAGAQAWRKALARTAAQCGFTDYFDFATVFGPKWAYVLKQSIMHPPQPVTRDKTT
jgi:hypothetical protein